MYNKKLTAALAIAVLGSGSAVAIAADKPGADWITLEQAVEKAKAAGYTELHGIEADDDGWEGEGRKLGLPEKAVLSGSTRPAWP